MIGRIVVTLLMTMGIVVVGETTSVSADNTRPTAGRGSSQSQFWVKLRVNTNSRHRPTGVQHADRSPTSTANAGPTNQLPTLLYLFGSGLQSMCGGGRAVVACPATAADPPGAVPPQVTPGLVLTALRRIGLPGVQARTQPEDKTLVNFPTIFYADPRLVSRTVTLLGRRVQIVATPQSFTWHYGDGTSTRTSEPGAPYPATDITHNYKDAHVTVRTSVDVAYGGRFRVGSGEWQTIPGSVTIAGPLAPLRVSEATAVLSGNYQ